MASRTKESIRLSACVLLIAYLYTAHAEVPVNAGGGRVTVASAQLFGDCFDDDACGPEFSCDDPCWSYAPELPPFETTCGEYGGPPWNGYGNCLGECGDGYCNEFNDEEYGLSGCPQDCGWCGDDKCQSPNETLTGYCEDDCGPNLPELPGGAECDPERQEGCDIDEFCNTQGTCVEVSHECSSTGFCEETADCCEGVETCAFPYATSQYGLCLPVRPIPTGGLFTPVG
jgi:hypothetical protein